MKVCLSASLAVLMVLMSSADTLATIAPQKGGRMSRALTERIRRQPRAFTYLTRLDPTGSTHQGKSPAAAPGTMTPQAAAAAGGTAVAGTRSIPVLPVTFSNTTSEPFPTANLQRELFDGPWPTGTMTDYYREVSYGKFTVTGTVAPWKKLPQSDSFYEGAPQGGTPCNGVCDNAKVGDMLKDTLDLSDAGTDFSQFDNDGPDNLPNSGDDDGFVDFVAFVHPEKGGECESATNNNIWSHRWTYSTGRAASLHQGRKERRRVHEGERLRHHAGASLRRENDDPDWRLLPRVWPCLRSARLAPRTPTAATAIRRALAPGA